MFVPSVVVYFKNEQTFWFPQLVCFGKKLYKTKPFCMENANEKQKKMMEKYHKMKLNFICYVTNMDGKSTTNV